MIGYRNWEFDRQRKCLVGNYGAEWHGKMAKADKELTSRNSSGIYAGQDLTDYASGICGAVDMSGKIFIHSDGIIRSQYSTILWLTYFPYSAEDEKEEREVKLFCKEKDILFVDSLFLSKKINDIQTKLNREIENNLCQDLKQNFVSIPATDHMFATVISSHSLDYTLYAQVKFQIVKDSLDYKILKILSEMKASIRYHNFVDILAKEFKVSNNYFIHIYHHNLCADAVRRLSDGDFVGSIDNNLDSYINIKERGEDLLKYIDQHYYYSYNTKESRFVHSPRYRYWIFAYRTEDGQYKIISNGKVSDKISNMEEVLNICRDGFLSCWCQEEMNEAELDLISGYYEISSVPGSRRIPMSYYNKVGNHSF